MKMQGYIIENKLAPDHDQQLVNTYFPPPPLSHYVYDTIKMWVECLDCLMTNIT